MSEIILDIEKIDVINKYFIKSERKKQNITFPTFTCPDIRIFGRM